MLLLLQLVLLLLIALPASILLPTSCVCAILGQQVLELTSTCACQGRAWPMCSWRLSRNGGGLLCGLILQGQRKQQEFTGCRVTAADQAIVWMIVIAAVHAAGCADSASSCFIIVAGAA